MFNNLATPLNKHELSIFTEAKRLHTEEKFLDACNNYKEILKWSPNNKEAHRLLGLAYQELSEIDLSRKHLKEAIKLDSNCHLSYCSLADLFFQQEDYLRAGEYFESSLKINPSYINALLGLANTFKALGNISKSQDIYLHILSIDDTHLKSLLNLGEIYLNTNELPSAKMVFEQAINKHPEQYIVHYSYAIFLKETGNFELAIQKFQKSIDLNPDDIESRNHIATILSDHHFYDEAIMIFKSALVISKDSSSTHHNLANTYRHSGHLDLALQEYKKASELDPNNIEALTGISAINLLSGDFKLGWELYAERYKNDYLNLSSEIPWTSRSDDVKKLIIRSLYGIGVGDIFMYSRFITQLIDAGIDCIVEVEDRIKATLQQSFPNVDLCTPLELKKEFQNNKEISQLSMAALPHFIGLSTVDEISRSPYIKPDKEAVNSIRQRYKNGNDLLVGISWNSNGKRGKYRSIPLDHWKDILKLPGIQFVSLQYDADNQDKTVNDNLIFDDSFNPVIDLHQAVSQVAAMDLVITIDNSCLHFAGSMGIPAWGLIPSSPDWRWGSEGENSYWHESVRLYRQTDPRSWDEVLQLIKENLQHWKEDKS